MINLLEGLRDLKAPLASGLIILFGVWLIYANEIAATKQGESVAGNLLQLANYLGGPATLGLIAFLGYLIGLVLNLHRFYRAFGRFISKAMDRLFELIYKKNHRRILPTEYSYTTLLRLNDYIVSVLKDAKENRGWTLEEITKVANIDSGSSMLADRNSHDPTYDVLLSIYDSEFTSVVGKLRKQITADMDLLAVQLQAEKEKIYEQYDKNKTESDFRTAIVLPTMFVAVVLLLRFASESQTVTYVIIVALMVVTIRLMSSADERLFQANETVLNSLIVGHIKSPKLLVFEQSRLPKPDVGREA